MKLAFKDFKPEIKEKGFFSNTYEAFKDSLQRANDWISAEKPEILNVETVVLPNLLEIQGGNSDPVAAVQGDRSRIPTGHRRTAPRQTLAWRGVFDRLGQ